MTFEDPLHPKAFYDSIGKNSTKWARRKNVKQNNSHKTKKPHSWAETEG